MATATKSSGIYVRVDPNIKSSVEEVFSKMGLTTAKGIDIYLNKVAQEKRIPFEITAIPHVKYLDELSKEEIVDMATESHNRIQKGKYITGEEFIDYLEGLN